MVVVAAGGDERGLVAHPGHDVEAEDADVELERPVDVGHLQMDVADVDGGVDRAEALLDGHRPAPKPSSAAPTRPGRVARL